MSSTISPAGFDSSAFGTATVHSSTACEIISEAGRFTQTFGVGRTLVMGEAGHGIDSIIAARASYIIEGMHGTDTLSYERASIMSDSAVAAEVWSPVAYHFATIVDGALASDLYSAFRQFNIEETGHAAESYTPSRMFVLSDAPTVSELFTPIVQATDIMIDKPLVVESFSIGRSSVISDVAHGSVIYVIARSSRIEDVVVGSESYIIRSLLNGKISEKAVASDSVSAIVDAIQLMSEEGCVEDTYTIPGTASAYSAPTDSFGMSRYDGMLVNSIASYNGSLVGAGTLGVFVFDASSNSDNGSVFDQSVELSVWDGGKAVMKRPGYAYLGLELIASANYTMQIGMTHFQDGAPTEIDVSAEPHPKNGYVSTRFKLPRGVRSFYYQFKINVSGATFKLDDMRVVFDLMSRKV